METDKAGRRRGRSGAGYQPDGNQGTDTPEDERLVRLRARLAELPRERGQLLPALWAAQDEFGWVTGEAIVAISERLRVPVSEVDGVTTGYPDLHRAEPVPTIRVCSGPACLCAGGDPLATALANSPQGARIERVPCLFACALAPTIEIGERVYGRMTVQRTIQLASSVLPQGDEQ